MNIYPTYQPYTYFIQWSSTGMKYYGLKYAKGCHSEEFWKTYFTSSDYVTAYRAKYGDPDIIQIRKTFTNSKRAKEWESRVLRLLRVSTREDYLNKNEGSLQINWDDPEIKERHRRGLIEAHTRPEVKKANSEAQKIAQNKPEQKEKLSKASKKLWENMDHKAKMKAVHSAMWENEEFRQRQTEARKRAANKPEVKLANSIRNTGSGNSRYDHTKYHFIHYNGIEEVSTRYELQIKYNFPSNSGMSNLISGKIKSTYGWRLKR